MARYSAPLIAAYLLVAALVLVGSPLAAEEGQAPPAPSQGDPNAVPPPPNQAPPAPPAAPAPTADQPTPSTDQADPSRDQAAPEQPVAVAAGPGSVSIVDYSFNPGSITVNVGDTVTWTNTGKQGHSATGSGFDTGILSKGQSGSHTFSSPGTFSYHCTPHPFMKGTVVVRASSSGGPSGGSSGGGSSSGGGGGTAGAGSQTSGSTGSGSAGSSSSGLPATGADVALLGGLGLALLGLGLAIRRRVGPA